MQVKLHVHVVETKMHFSCKRYKIWKAVKWSFEKFYSNFVKSFFLKSKPDLRCSNAERKSLPNGKFCDIIWRLVLWHSLRFRFLYQNCANLTLKFYVPVFEYFYVCLSVDALTIITRHLMWSSFWIAILTSLSIIVFCELRSDTISSISWHYVCRQRKILKMFSVNASILFSLKGPQSALHMTSH